MKENSDYSFRSSAWDDIAGVRSNPETYDLQLSDDYILDGTGLSWHLPSYSGILEHEDLSHLSGKEKEFVKGTQLLEFVTKQTIFEINCVNYVASRLAHNKYKFDLCLCNMFHLFFYYHQTLLLEFQWLLIHLQSIKKIF